MRKFAIGDRIHITPKLAAEAQEIARQAKARVFADGWEQACMQARINIMKAIPDPCGSVGVVMILLDAMTEHARVVSQLEVVPEITFRCSSCSAEVEGSLQPDLPLMTSLLVLKCPDCAGQDEDNTDRRAFDAAGNELQPVIVVLHGDGEMPAEASHVRH